MWTKSHSVRELAITMIFVADGILWIDTGMARSVRRLQNASLDFIVHKKIIFVTTRSRQEGSHIVVCFISAWHRWGQQFGGEATLDRGKRDCLRSFSPKPCPGLQSYIHGMLPIRLLRFKSCGYALSCNIVASKCVVPTKNLVLIESLVLATPAE